MRSRLAWRVAERWLASRLPRRALDTVLGDLEDDYARRLTAGRLVADIWLWREARSVARAYRRGRTSMPGWWQHQCATLADDLRLAWRLAARAPGFAAVSILMIALGTGANAAMFSVIDGVMLRPPLDQPDQIAEVRATTPAGRAAAVPRAAFDRLAGLTHLFVATAEFTNSSPVVSAVDVPRRTQVECVPASMRAVLGVTPLMGRWFSESEDQPGGPPVIVVSHAFWMGALGGDPGVLGRVVSLDNAPVTIVGVMRPGFDGPLSLRDRDIWAPLGQAAVGQPAFGCEPRADSVTGFVRLQPGVTPEQAAEVASAVLLAAALAAGLSAGPAAGSSSEPMRLAFTTLWDATFDTLQAPFLALSGAVVAVLLIACANVANLGLAQMLGRRREIAVRLALGAGRARIIRQTVTERVALVLAGAALGVLVARLTIDAVVSALPRGVPHAQAITMNAPVLLAAFGVALLAGVGVGLIPAAQASSVQMRSALGERDHSISRRGRGIRRVLVTGELALGVLLLVGAWLMVTTFLTLRPGAPGFDPAGKTFALTRLPGDMTLRERQAFVDDVRGDLLRLPGVTAAVSTTYLPMRRVFPTLDMAIDGESGRTNTATVTPDYFEAMGIPVTRGRPFDGSDVADADAVAIVNDAFVRRWLPGREPIGTVVTIGSRQVPESDRVVVGVIGDTRAIWSDTRARPELYIPMSQAMAGSPYFIVNAGAAARATLPADLRRIVERVRPGQLVDLIESYEALLADEVSRPRFGAWLLGLLAGLAVVLAAGGLAAALVWSVAERRREIGIRMALGARPGQVRTLIVRQTCVLAGTGVSIGLGLAALTTRLLEGWLYGVTPMDAASFGGAAAIMFGVAMVAAYLPTRRATSIDPHVVLRGE